MVRPLSGPRTTALFVVLVVVVGCAITRYAFVGGDSSAPGAAHPAPIGVAVAPIVQAPPTTAPAPPPTTRPPVKPVAPPKGPGPGGSLKFTGNKGVALTFDDGPDPDLTPKVLDLLKKQKVKATFCVLGYRAKKYPGLVKRIAAEGHALCNHTWDHALDLAAKKSGGGYKHSDAAIRADLQRTNDAIRAAVPKAKIGYFRAPGGNFTKRLVGIAAKLGMKSIYWSVDPSDWDNGKYGNGSRMAKHIIGVVKRDTRPGAIVLSHDLAAPATLTAYRTLLPWLKHRYKLVPLP
ncbi:polysaccharide deacetylase family protein [Luedemannella helvata]|uniref:NodB homology domain-containing protein n=1 Tax=Luedemannella helvata TaxID=349315 RepID=A0ABN2K3M5_9ACTN